jgi:hypothetical protein
MELVTSVILILIMMGSLIKTIIASMYIIQINQIWIVTK